jgi:hypothetical protein
MATMNDAIHSISMQAFQEGLKRGFREGREEAIHETFVTLELILNDIWEHYYRYPAQQEAICEIQSKVENLKERLSAQIKSE